MSYHGPLPELVVCRARELYAQRESRIWRQRGYHGISKLLFREFHITVASSTVRDWCKFRTRTAMADEKLPADWREWIDQIGRAAAALKTTLVSQRRVSEWRRAEWNKRVDDIVKEAAACAEAVSK